MQPGLASGDWLLFTYWEDGLLAQIIGEEGLASLASHGRVPQRFHHKLEKRAQSLVGKVLLIEREAQPGLFQVKGVVRILESTRGEYMFWVEGDNKEASTDSRTWGAVSAAEVKGVARFRYRRSRQQ